MMGAGKSSVGRRLAPALGIPFVDADAEIETAAGMTIPEIFDKHGEPYFRAGEARVIARLLGGGPQVLATGGGAMMDASTRALVRDKGISIWLKADLDMLLRRTKRRNDRPLVGEDQGPAAAARADLCAGRHHRAVARRAARHHRRRDRRRAARASSASTRRPRHDRAAARLANRSSSQVALGARAYDIVIGRGLLASLGARIKALRPGARAAIVTDDDGRQASSASRRGRAANPPASTSPPSRVPPGEGSKSYASFETRLRGDHRLRASSAAIWSSRSAAA